MAIAKIGKTIFGREVYIGRKYGDLGRKGVSFTSKCIDASITVGAKSSNARAITIQLLDGNAKALDYAEECELILFLDATPSAYVVTGGSTGIAIGASGALEQIIAKKRFRLLSTTAGVVALTYTDTGTEAVCFGVRLPTGRIVLTAAFATG